MVPDPTMNERTLESIRRLHRLGRQVSSVRRFSTILEIAAETIAELLPANRVSIIELDMPKRRIGHFARGGPGQTRIVEVSFEELNQGLTGWTLKHGQTALSSKLEPDPRESPEVQKRRRETDCGSIMVVPLRFTGSVVGTITVINTPSAPDFTQDDVETMELFADFCAVLIESSRKRLEQQKVKRELLKLNKTFETLFENAPFNAVLSRLEDGRMVRVNREFERAMGYTRDEAIGKTTVDLGIHLDTETRAKILADLKDNGTVRDLEIQLLSKTREPRTFSINIEVVEINNERFILQMSHDITELKMLQEKLRIESILDPLTRVFNRRHFLALAEVELQRADRHHGSVALVMADIDHFKHVNDHYGHQTGDEALVRFASVFQQEKRDIDIFARFGGEEFLLLLPETTLEQAVEVAERLRQRVEASPVVFGGRQLTLTCSLGVASYAAESLDSLISKADTALYDAKSRGRNRVQIFGSSS
jgi:diguanylate cyclase (GGDEF)-like protein/PAS domain S-box-containing protein